MSPEGPRHERGVDIDLLADYAGGALDDARERERVHHLVGTDPEWAGALEQLRAADALVRADLATLAGDPAPMPPDVAARIDSTLRDLGDAPAPVVSLDTKRRRYRRAAVAAVAAGVVGIAGFSWYAVAGPSGLDAGSVRDSQEAATEARPEPSPRTSANRGPRSEHAAPGGAPSANGPTRYPVPVSASGRNYTRSNLFFTVPNAGTKGSVRPPAGLERLASPAELSGCLDGIGKTYPGSVNKVDYARFEDKPALIVSIQQRGDKLRVVVAGPDCRESDTDQKYTAAR